MTTMLLGLLALLACSADDAAASKRAALDPASISWDLVLDAEDAELDGVHVERLEASTGQVFDDAADAVHRPTLAGRAQGGVAPLTFDADARLQSEDPIVAGSVTGWTVEVVHQPADVYGVLDRGYLLYAVNNTPSAPYHHVVAHTANSPQFSRKGIYLAGAWELALPSVEVYTGLQVETWVARPNGAVNYWRNGHEVDHYEWSAATIQLDQLVLGAGWGDPLATAYRGQIYSVRSAGRALSKGEIYATQTQQIARYAIASDYEWQPSDEASLSGWWSEHGMRRTSGAVYQWDNRDGLYHASQGASARQPGADRIDGLLAVDCDGADDRLTGYSISYYVGASSWEAAAIIELHSAPATASGLPYNLRGLYGDVAGFWGGAVRESTTPGVYDFVAWQYNGTTTKSAVATGITLGARHTVHAWLDNGVLHAAVDGVEGTSASSAGAISNSVYQLTLCGRSDATATEVEIGGLVLFGSALSSTSRAELEAWLVRGDT